MSLAHQIIQTFLLILLTVLGGGSGQAAPHFEKAALSAGTQFLTSSINLKAMSETDASTNSLAMSQGSFAAADDLGTRYLLEDLGTRG